MRNGIWSLIGLVLLAMLVRSGEVHYEQTVYRDITLEQWAPTGTIGGLLAITNGAYAASQTVYYALAVTNPLGRSTIGSVTSLIVLPDQYVRISWPRVGGASGYLLYRGTTTNLAAYAECGSATQHYDWGTNDWTAGTPTNTITAYPEILLPAAHTSDDARAVMPKGYIDNLLSESEDKTNDSIASAADVAQAVTSQWPAIDTDSSDDTPLATYAQATQDLWLALSGKLPLDVWTNWLGTNDFAHLWQTISTNAADARYWNLDGSTLIRGTNGMTVEYGRGSTGLVAALTAAAQADTIYVGPGYYDIGTNAWELPVYCGLVGAGQGQTHISGGVGGWAYPLPLFYLQSNQTYRSMSLYNTKNQAWPWNSYGAVFNGSSNGYSGVVIQDVYAKGYADCVYLGGGASPTGTIPKVVVRNSWLRSDYDTLVIGTFGSFWFEDTIIEARGPNLFAGQLRAYCVSGMGNTQGQYDVRFSGGAMLASAGQNYNQGIIASQTGAMVTCVGVYFDVVGTDIVRTVQATGGAKMCLTGCNIQTNTIYTQAPGTVWLSEWGMGPNITNIPAENIRAGSVASEIDCHLVTNLPLSAYQTSEDASNQYVNATGDTIAGILSVQAITNVSYITGQGPTAYGLNFEDPSSYSTMLWQNLNADVLDGYHAAAFALANEPLWSGVSNQIRLGTGVVAITGGRLSAAGQDYALLSEIGAGGGIVLTVLEQNTASTWDPATGTLGHNTNDAAGAGDMLAATYDPAGGAKQVAFADDLAGYGTTNAVAQAQADATAALGYSNAAAQGAEAYTWGDHAGLYVPTNDTTYTATVGKAGTALQAGAAGTSTNLSDYNDDVGYALAGVQTSLVSWTIWPPWDITNHIGGVLLPEGGTLTRLWTRQFAGTGVIQITEAEYGDTGSACTTNAADVAVGTTRALVASFGDATVSTGGTVGVVCTGYGDGDGPIEVDLEYTH